LVIPVCITKKLVWKYSQLYLKIKTTLLFTLLWLLWLNIFPWCVWASQFDQRFYNYSLCKCKYSFIGSILKCYWRHFSSFFFFSITLPPWGWLSDTAFVFHCQTKINNWDCSPSVTEKVTKVCQGPWNSIQTLWHGLLYLCRVKLYILKARYPYTLRQEWELFFSISLLDVQCSLRLSKLGEKIKLM
jgi:hypothetical protein